MSAVYPKIVLWGDSITQYGYESPSGYASLLSDAYQRRVDVVARGLAGYNTRWALPLMEPVLQSLGDKFEAISIFFGTNDCCFEGNPQHVPPEEFATNLSKMVEIARKYTDAIVVVGTTMVDEKGSHPGCEFRSNKQSYAYNAIAKSVAEVEQVQFLDLWSAFRTDNGEPVAPAAEVELAGEKGYAGDKQASRYLRDGIHFTGHGYEIYFMELVELLANVGKGPNDYEWVFPAWRDLPEVGK